MIRISIDGACRRNGKPDCVSAAGAFVQIFEDNKLVFTETLYGNEHGSTNQRGELHALILALGVVAKELDDTQIITDSEYIFNAMTKCWYATWKARGWHTASGGQVKNADLWKQIAQLVDKCGDADINYYHIKGHCIPFGRVTAENLLIKDTLGSSLMYAVYDKYDAVVSTKKEVFEAAQELSLKNNGFKLSDEVLRDFVVANTVADAIATSIVELADRKI